VDLVLGQVSAEAGSGGTGSCGDVLTTNVACEQFACGSCATSNIAACDNSAETNECSKFADAASSTTGLCADLVIDAAPGLARCFPQTNADDVTFLDVFCGTGP